MIHCLIITDLAAYNQVCRALRGISVAIGININEGQHLPSGKKILFIL